MTTLFQHHELTEVVGIESHLRGLKIWNVAKKMHGSI